MVNTVALEAVSQKKGGKGAGLMRNLSHLKQLGASRPRVCLGPRAVAVTHCLCCVPADVFKVRLEGWQVIFSTASVTLEEG